MRKPSLVERKSWKEQGREEPSVTHIDTSILASKQVMLYHLEHASKKAMATLLDLRL